MSDAARRHRLRVTLESAGCVGAVSVFDPLSARGADRLGFQVGVMGGSVASLIVIGAPDLALITLDELAEQTARAARAGQVSLIVDADHGYGNALGVMRCVHKLAAAGAAALTLEDTQLPRAFGTSAGPAFIDITEAMGKLEAALVAREASGILVLARTNALPTLGMKEVLRRLTAYERTGVDALFLPYLQRRAELEEISRATRLPLVLGNPAEELIDLDYLARMRVKVLLTDHAPYAAAAHATYASQAAAARLLLQSEGRPEQPNFDMPALSLQEQYAAWSHRWMG